MDDKNTQHRSIQIVQNEITTLITSMRKVSTSRWGTTSTFRSIDEEPDEFLKSLYFLRSTLISLSDLFELDCSMLLAPFIGIIRDESISGYITGLALLSLNKFIIYEVISANSKGIMESIDTLAHVITHTRFQGNEQAKDEVVLIWILTVLRNMITSPLGVFLSNENICECLQSCFRICFEVRLSELLRKDSEETLNDLLRHILRRARDFTEENHSESEQEVTLQRENLSDSTSYTGDSESYTEDMGRGTEEVVTDKIEDNPSTNGLLDIEDTEITTDIPVLTDAYQLSNNITNSELNHTKERPPYQPYGLPCIKESIRFVASLINPFDKRNSTQMLKIGLNLLKTVLENLPANLDCFPTLVKLIQDNVCKYLVFLLRHDSLQIFASVLQNAYILFVTFRSFLKLQLEIFYNKLMEMVSNEKLFFAKKEIIMENLVQILNAPNFARDIYINYDCCLYQRNLFEDTCIFLSNLDNSQNGLSTLHMLACEAVVNISRNIARHHTVANSDDSTAQVDSAKSRKLTPEDAVNIRSIKKELLAGSLAFTQKPSEGIEYFISHKLLKNPPEPMEVAVLLKRNPWLSKKSIGEYLCNKKLETTLTEFIKQSDFNGLPLLSAVREFNQSIRLSGEAPVIQRVMEIFSDYWLEENENGIGNVFANVDAVFVLTYAILMLNTDQHNPEVKDPMSFEAFNRIQREMNGGKNFPVEMLRGIYTDIKENEIVIPEEKGGIVLDEHLWKMASKLSTSPEAQFYDFFPALIPEYDKDIFGLIWRPTISVLSFVFENATCEAIILKAIEGFKQLSLVSSHFNQPFILDKVIHTVSNFSYLLSPVENLEDFVLLFGSSSHAKLSISAVFDICIAHGNIMRDSWKDILLSLFRIYQAQLFPIELLSVENYLTEFEEIISYTENAGNKQDASIISSILSYMTSDSQRVPNANEVKAKESALECIRNCNIDKLLQDTKYLCLASLQELIRSLITFSQNNQETMSHAEEEKSIFFLELLVKITTTNRDRAASFWQELETHLFSLILNGMSSLRFCERAVVSLLQAINSLFSMGSMSERALQSLKIFLCIPQTLLTEIGAQLLAGIRKIISTRHLLIRRVHDWSVIFAIVELTGSGCCPDLVSFRNELARTTSDNSRISQKILQVPWEFSLDPKDRLTLCPVPYRFTSCLDSYQQALTLISSLLLDHCPSLSATNILAFTHAVRTFAEVTSHLPPSSDPINPRTAETNPNSNLLSVPFWEKEQQKCLNLLVVTFNHVHEICTQIALDELHFTAEGMNSDLKRVAWVKGYCPLLQGMANLATSRNRSLRQSAFTVLQKSLLSPHLADMHVRNWLNCLERIFFPLLDYLLKKDKSITSSSLEETRTRSITILCKVFLQHLTNLQALPEFVDLWIQILDYMKHYMLLENSDLLCEAIPECLKNMLLVMKTADIFENSKIQFNNASLWDTTCHIIHEFLPNLMHELFPGQVTTVLTVTSPPTDSKPSTRSPLVEISHTDILDIDQVIIIQPPLPPVQSTETNTPTHNQIEITIPENDPPPFELEGSKKSDVIHDS
ncbi:hypothetical protein LOD99_4351 [Oopsacas minuta]|uniref:SEC7 domain-containing protein n=1 Tax=Oopsacas minuta TaxID=111878 RepID=A0AAV7JUK4_9METZ|nr:hypothetical protein LOD99_4351 [Oopsacas minuta]